MFSARRLSGLRTRQLAVAYPEGAIVCSPANYRAIHYHTVGLWRDKIVIRRCVAITMQQDLWKRTQKSSRWALVDMAPCSNPQYFDRLCYPTTPVSCCCRCCRRGETPNFSSQPEVRHATIESASVHPMRKSGPDELTRRISPEIPGLCLSPMQPTIHLANGVKNSAMHITAYGKAYSYTLPTRRNASVG